MCTASSHTEPNKGTITQKCPKSRADIRSLLIKANRSFSQLVQSSLSSLSNLILQIPRAFHLIFVFGVLLSLFQSSRAVRLERSRLSGVGMGWLPVSNCTKVLKRYSVKNADTLFIRFCIFLMTVQKIPKSAHFPPAIWSKIVMHCYSSVTCCCALQVYLTEKTSAPFSHSHFQNTDKNHNIPIKMTKISTFLLTISA